MIDPLRDYIAASADLVELAVGIVERERQLTRYQAAALDELDSLRSFLRKGKPVTAFTPFSLPEADYRWVVRALSRTSTAEALRGASERLRKGLAGAPAHLVRRGRERESALQPIATSVAAELGSLVRGLQTGSLSHLHFVDQGADTMRTAYIRAYRAGAAAGQPLVKQADDGSDDEDLADLPDDVQQEIMDAADQQHGYLQGLVQDLVAGMAAAAIAARLDLYGAGLVPFYESGYQDEVVPQIDQGSGVMATWNCLADDPCGLCEARNGQSWPVEEAPLPGDGGFGEQCEGGPWCRCILDYESVGDEMAA